uniref:Uncharacterized protein n=1 Tax=Chromera velia CCMP2878 TaxID=1169474 RepID=A0A0G4I6D0_9ALVE|eukprot:Cvel_11377.t1-p1 / transcript=Cvel_11377.t1 / gene=Cvel_11377 / organism=Chromera_velia_CCMP2878 / gene_product=hypothetical protein / transcript_product=hypothetical protein / location=Cvel_scaffold713:41872-42219(-) / protein_length=116 / sequence_SO=supercontig / SO=protein_coding / is_pseudo=false
MGEEFLRKVCGRFQGVVSRRYEIDLSSFFQGGIQEIGEVIRSFRGIAAKDFQREFSAFLKGRKDENDVRLFLKAGVDVNGLVRGQTALMKAICADSMDDFQMIMEEKSDLEVRAGE